MRLTKEWTEVEIEKLVTLRLEGSTWNEISEIIGDISPNGARKAFYRYIRDGIVSKTLNQKGVKILVIDLETSPLEYYGWGLFDQNPSLDMIIKDWSILSFAAKWLGDPESEVMYQDTRNEKDPRDDSKLLRTIHSLVDEADVLLIQNSKFDIGKFNARFIQAGLKPPSSYKVIDTYKIAKKKFGFTSNKLAYLTDKLCTTYKKLDHGQFSGFKLWRECLAGNKKAWEEMEKYNKYDILSLEELYLKMAAWDDSINIDVYHDELTDRCFCGSPDFRHTGYVYTKTSKFQRFTCSNCGKERRGKDNLLSKDKKLSLKR